MLPYADLCILRKFASLTGVLDMSPTLTGVRGVIVHEGSTLRVELVVVPSSGAIELLCLTGPDAGTMCEVSSLAELREGHASGALAAAALQACAS